MTNYIWYNSEGKVRLTWKLAGIIIINFCLLYLTLYLIYKVSQGLGIPLWQLLRFLEEWELWIYQVSMLAVLALFIFVIDRFTLYDVGMAGRPGGLTHLLFGLALGAVLISTGFAVMHAAGWVTITSSGGPAGNAASGGVTLLKGAALFAMVGLSEEVLFRGYFFKYHTGSAVHAVIVSSIFFAVMHTFNPNTSVIGLINIFIAGVLFACIYLWSGSLYLPIGLHFAWNYVMGHIFGLPVSGLAIEGLLQVEVTGPAWITGGDFGLEGGLLATLLLLMGFALARIYTRLRRKRIT